MSTPNAHTPIPRQPIGTTFVVAISLLGALAIIQLFAVAWHYIPLVRQQVAKTSETQVLPQDSPPAPAPSTPHPVPIASADVRKAQKLMADADRSSRVGDFEAALKLLDELGKLLPGDPSVLLRKAQVLERLDQPAEAVLVLEQTLKYPGLPEEVRTQAQTKLDQLSQALASTSSAPGDVAPALPDAAGADIRDDVGLQPGASLGIVDARLREGKPGTKVLVLAVKSRPGSSINVQDVKIHVYFYEQTEEGEVVLTESKVVPQWLSPPVDWGANEPELLEVQYMLPESGLAGSVTANGSPERKYFGYIVGVYYSNELQDFRADPASMAKDFPLQLYLKESGE
ncbi:MAG TPA: tetratricopeptide repeat protein [Terrimicrobiaceae bacterium]